MSRETTAGIVVAVLTAATPILAKVAQRWLYPPGPPGGRAHARVLGIGWRGRRARVSTSTTGGLTVKARGQPAVSVPRQAALRPLTGTRKEHLRVAEEFSVKLEWEGYRLFLRPDDWRTLTRFRR